MTNIEKIFRDAQDIVSNYQNDVTSTLKTYQINADLNKNILKDSALEEQRHTAAVTALAALKHHQQDFAIGMTSIVDRLKDILQTSATAMPKESFLNCLRVFNEFEIPMTRTDVESMLQQSLAYPLGLKALNAVLKRTNSEFRVAIPGSEQLEADIATLQALANNPVWSPFKGENEGLHHAFRIVTGMDNTLLLIEASEFNARAAAITDMPIRWNNATQPQFAEDVIQTIDTVSITQPDKAEAFGRQLGQMQAEQATEFEHTMSHYKK